MPCPCLLLLVFLCFLFVSFCASCGYCLLLPCRSQRCSGKQTLLCPGLNFVEAVVALRGDVAEPDAGDLAEGQRALPAMPGGEVAVEDLGQLKALQRGQQDGEVVHPFHTMHLRGCGTHTPFAIALPLS